MKPDRKLVLAKTNGRCAYCGSVLNDKWHIDHIIPQRNFINSVQNQWRIPEFLKHLTVFDQDHIDNLFASCCSCNNYKDTFSLEQFRTEIGHLTERLNSTFTQYKIAKRFGLIEETGNKVTFYFETFKQKENATNKNGINNAKDSF